MYIGLRPTTSEVEDQTNLPAMLAIDSTPTKPAAALELTAVVPPSRKKSWIIGAACSRMPMPAVTLQNSTIHSSQNCGVLIALAAETLLGAPGAVDLPVAGSTPAGFQPSAGTRTMKAPNIMKAR